MQTCIDDPSYFEHKGMYFAEKLRKLNILVREMIIVDAQGSWITKY